MKPEDKQYEMGGVFRCCIESLRLAVLPSALTISPTSKTP